MRPARILIKDKVVQAPASLLRRGHVFGTKPRDGVEIFGDRKAFAPGEVAVIEDGVADEPPGGKAQGDGGDDDAFGHQLPEAFFQRLFSAQQNSEAEKEEAEEDPAVGVVIGKKAKSHAHGEQRAGFFVPSFCQGDRPGVEDHGCAEEREGVRIDVGPQIVEARQENDEAHVEAPAVFAEEPFSGPQGKPPGKGDEQGGRHAGSDLEGGAAVGKEADDPHEKGGDHVGEDGIEGVGGPPVRVAQLRRIPAGKLARMGEKPLRHVIAHGLVRPRDLDCAGQRQPRRHENKDQKQDADIRPAVLRPFFP